MGLSLVLVAGLWLWIGHIGPSYSANLIIKQQVNLGQQYGLPHKPVVLKSTTLLIPPSLRNASLRNCIPYSAC